MDNVINFLDYAKKQIHEHKTKVEKVLTLAENAFGSGKPQFGLKYVKIIQNHANVMARFNRIVQHYNTIGSNKTAHRETFAVDAKEFQKWMALQKIKIEME